MSNQKKQLYRKLRKILVLLIILVIILALLVKVYAKLLKYDPNTHLKNLKYINNSESWKKETLYPQKTFTLDDGYTYVGELTKESIGKSMYYVATKVFPMYYKDLKNANEEEISEYFSNHSDIIKIDTGIDNIEDFEYLIDYLKSDVEVEKLELDSFRIEPYVTYKYDDYTYTLLYITYKNVNEKMFEIKIFNQIKDNMTSIEYKGYVYLE